MGDASQGEGPLHGMPRVTRISQATCSPGSTFCMNLEFFHTCLFQLLAVRNRSAESRTLCPLILLTGCSAGVGPLMPGSEVSHAATGTST